MAITYPSSPSVPKYASPLCSWVGASIVGVSGLVFIIQGILRLISEINKGVLRLTSSSKNNTLYLTSEINKGELSLRSRIQLRQ